MLAHGLLYPWPPLIMNAFRSPYNSSPEPSSLGNPAFIPDTITPYAIHVVMLKCGRGRVIRDNDIHTAGTIPE